MCRYGYQLYGFVADATTVRPLLLQMDDMDGVVAKLEENAHRLDGYTKQLKARLREMNGTKWIRRHRHYYACQIA